MTTFNRQTLLPCDKVLSIQELLESILLYLDFDDPTYSRLLATVCQRWYRYKLISVKSTILSLNLVELVLICGIDTLHLTLDQHSVSVPYDQLDETFIRTQDRLTTVSIKLDASLLNVSILWTLSRLPHLAHLCLQVYGIVDMAALHAEILGCCPALQSLKLDRWKPSAPLPLFRRLKTNVQRTLAPKAQRSPTTVQEAIGRNEITPNRQTLTLSVVQPQQHQPSTLEQGTNTNIRRLDLCGLSGDIPVFIQLIMSCSQLDELCLRDGLTALDPPSWAALSSRCPTLRILRLTGLKSSLLIGNSLLLITHFPQLESLIAAMPALEYFHLEDGSISEGSLDALKDGFPKQFKPIPKERLAWIETIHGYN
ncbi:hypothetical protein KI688_002816 [Linnemannia hyalina]|uniref:F-box domain-containing protein n=1 Tax=Linnemannia hyalina TaxID=64524 RepID=A0A9P7XQT9_9FUNG|nr:hypothetical protein KI688_002816 [Linnemannia hyalina]